MNSSTSSTNLHLAVIEEDVAKVNELLKNGYKVDKQDKAGRTPLMYACMVCNKEIVTLLIGAGADVNAKDNKGTTPLMWLVK